MNFDIILNDQASDALDSIKGDAFLTKLWHGIEHIKNTLMMLEL